MANQIRKLQDGRPTVKDNDRWNSTAQEQPPQPFQLGAGKGEGWVNEIDLRCFARISNFQCSHVRSCLSIEHFAKDWERVEYNEDSQFEEGQSRILGFTIVPFEVFDGLNFALIANLKHVQCL